MVPHQLSQDGTGFVLQDINSETMKLLLSFIFLGASWTAFAQSSIKEKRKTKLEGISYKEKIVKKEEGVTSAKLSTSRNYEAHRPAPTHFRAHVAHSKRHHSHLAYSKKHARSHPTGHVKNYKKVKRKYGKGKTKIKYQY
ncbi:MAG: hypothetical protein NVS1B13_07080 [Flavisolibacter sp.]